MPGGLLSPFHREDADEQLLREQVGQSMEIMAASLDAPVPFGWEVHEHRSDGRLFYVNSKAGITQWEVPRLPPQWEERFSKSGKVYYINLFDGNTQWQWPQELGKAGLQLALPGSTQALALLEPPTEARFEESDDDSVGAAANQMDADDLLNLPVGSELASQTEMDDVRPPTGQGLRETQIHLEKVTKQGPWGKDSRDEDWHELKRKLQLQKVAHEQRWETANMIPGLRDFVRPHEMNDQVNNWDRQLDNVTLKIANMERRNLALGHRAELRKEEFRGLFPVIQRLLWTKWSAGEIFLHALRKELPSQNVYLNIAKPSKYHRFLLHMLFVSTVLVGSSFMFLYKPSGIEEERQAVDMAVWMLAGEIFTMPWHMGTIQAVVLADIIGRFVKYCCRRVFFSYTLPANIPPSSTSEARKETLRYWHDLAETGKWVCIAGSFILVTATLALATLNPQLRAAAAARAFLIEQLWAHIVLPLLSATMVTLILCQARRKPTFDGFLSVFTGTMDFLTVGVQTPEFLAWRAQRIVSEEEMLLQVHQGGRMVTYDDIDD
jgi:hypothetical protein